MTRRTPRARAGSEPTYEARVVARVAGIPIRRMLGWLDPERGVLRPTIAARGRGTRRRFTRGDILQVAIVAELQMVFGSTNLRPGVIASEVAAWVKTIDPERLRAAQPTADT